MKKLNSFGDTTVDYWGQEAAKHFKIKYEEVTPEQRRWAKENLFGKSFSLEGLRSEIKTEFDLCMGDAKKLCNEYFSPEIDNLADQTIRSIVMKVLIERDIYTEGHLDDIPEEEGQKWLAQVDAFLEKWKPRRESE